MGYLEIIRQMLKKYGFPVTIYSDKYSVLYHTSSQKVTIEEHLREKEKPITQFKRIMDVLGLQLIAASISQVKGRIERLCETLQDRLVTKFKLNGIKTIEQANVFLPKYIEKYNNKFAVEPESSKSKFVLLPSYVDLDILLTNKISRVTDTAETFSIKNKKFQIVDNDVLSKTKIDIYISHKIGIIVEHKERR